jgi:hypothetical protein
MSKYAKLTAGLIAAWFVFSLTTSALYVYKIGTNGLALALGLAVVTPIALFLLWSKVSADFRKFTMSLNPRLLTMVQSWRIAGYVFLALATYGILPGIFAWPAGWGDIFIGLTAIFVALRLVTPDYRRSFIIWQLLGIADLVTAVTLGTLATVIDPKGIPTSAMTVLPLSLIPTFAVPLMLILHLICIAQAYRWPVKQRLPIADPMRSPAA